MKRRALLSAALLTATAGCLGGSGDQESTTRDCPVTKSKLSAEPVAPTGRQRQALRPVVVAEQSGRVRDVFAAVADGETVVGTCPKDESTDERTRALNDALGVVQDQLQRQREAYEGDVPRWVDSTAYLRRGDSWSALDARLSDQVVSFPADLPQRPATAASTSS